MDQQDTIDGKLTNYITKNNTNNIFNVYKISKSISTVERYWNGRPYFWENYFKEYYEAHGMVNVKIDYIRPSFVGKSKCLETTLEE